MSNLVYIGNDYNLTVGKIYNVNSINYTIDYLKDNLKFNYYRLLDDNDKISIVSINDFINLEEYRACLINNLLKK